METVLEQKGKWSILRKEIFFSPKALKLIYFFAILYLAVPQIIYMFVCFKSFLKPVILVLSIIIIIGVYRILPQKKEGLYIPIYLIIGTVFLTLFVLLLSGMGGICGVQMSDYDKTNAILSDLVNYNWPVIYNEANNISVLNYYIAFYIPGTFIGKLFGSLHIAEICTLIWALFGMLTGILLIIDVSKIKKLTSIIFFFCWGGLDWIGEIILGNGLMHGTEHIEQWANMSGAANGHIANYVSMAVGFIWGPQHYIAAVIFVALLLMLIRHDCYKLCCLLMILMLFWSPMIAIGAIPFGVALLIYNKGKILKFLSVTDILGIVVFGIPLVLYYLSMNLGGTGGSTSDGIRGLRWVLYNWPIVLLFIAIEFGIVWIIIFRLKTQKSTIDKVLLYTVLISMTGFLFFDYGACHDFSMRASVVSWIVLFTFVPSLYESQQGKKEWIYLIGYMIGAIITCLTEYTRLIDNFISHPTNCDRYIVSGNTLSDSGFAMEYQYVGTPSALFYQLFCDSDFNWTEYKNLLNQEKHRYMLHLFKDITIYFYDDVLYFYGENSGDIEIEYYYGDIKDTYYAHKPQYGTLSQIEKLYMWEINSYNWECIIIRDKNNSFNIDFQTLKQWAEERRWDSNIVVSSLNDVNWNNGVYMDKKSILLAKPSIFDRDMIGKNLYYNNEKHEIVDVVYGDNSTVVHIKDEIREIDELAKVNIN